MPLPGDGREGGRGREGGGQATEEDDQEEEEGEKVQADLTGSERAEAHLPEAERLGRRKSRHTRKGEGGIRL